ERPERDSFAVGEAPALAPVDEIRLLVQPLPQLSEEPRLADSRLADEGHEVHRLVAADAGVCLLEQRELRIAPHERGGAADLDVDSEAAARPPGAPKRHRLRLPLDADRVERLVVDLLTRRAVGEVADDQGSGLRGALQARGRVDDVACHHRLAELGAGAERDERLARLDRGASLESELPSDGDYAKAGADGPPGGVFVGD